MKKFFKILLWLIVLAIFVATFVFLYLNSKPKAEKYEIVSPTVGEIERTTVLTGQIEPRDEIEIKPQISGIVTQINVQPGDMVKAGDVIAVIKVIPDASQLSDAQSRVDLARIALEDARLKHERNQMLFDRKVIAREEYETSKATLDRCTSELAAAQDAVTIVSQGISRYNASEANTQVRATIDGLVLDVPVKVGTSVIQANTFNDGTTIATIADMNNLIFKGTADETEVGSLSIGMPMTISIGALPDYSAEATIEYISPKGESSGGANTFEIKAAVPTNGTSLRAGYSANATVALNQSENVLKVAESVVEFSGDSTFVYVLQDSVPTQKFKRTAITTGISDGINIEVKSGITKSALLRGQKLNEK
ncbi:MAG: efflux RND transporter periplasmic adaptor subunit [Bacteroides sp.]|nr:efflux RND transporter periplasmic adaptor subunit [Bacteroides sp.]MCM1413492.1 efflux RND transporter periplasmic adaptor subunit [Bacteroides sp.]MCM1471297.1 efflux RND transporter periplasmic adaptor subunit [Bacteroides sp.]